MNNKKKSDNLQTVEHIFLNRGQTHSLLNNLSSKKLSQNQFKRLEATLLQVYRYIHTYTHTHIHPYTHTPIHTYRDVKFLTSYFVRGG